MRKLLPAGLSLLAILVLSEIAARLFFPVKPLLPFVATDFLLGHKGPPGGDVVIWNNKLTYSPDGFRVLPRVPSKKKPAIGAPQIAWLGDSMIEAMTIGDFEHFSAQVESQTGAHGLLFAAGDWGTTQEFLAFREYGKNIEGLRAVVLGFSSLTDFVNNSPAFAGRYQSKMDGLRPYVTQDFEKPDFFRVRLLYSFFREASRLFLLFDNSRIARSLGSPVKMTPDCKENPNSIPLHGYFSDAGEDWRDSEQRTFVLLHLMNYEAGKIKSPFVAVYIPNDFELLDDKWEDTVRGPAEFCFPGMPLDRRAMEKRFLRAAKEAAVDAVSLYDYFAKEIKKQKDNPIFLDDGHFNPLGHTLLANAMVKILRERKLVE